MLVVGSLYALIGTGFVVLYRATKVMNFAQGAFMLVGGDVFYSMLVHYHLPWGLALAVTLAVSALVGAAVYVVFFRRLVGAEPFVLVIASLGLNIVIVTITLIIWGPGTHGLPQVLSQNSLFAFGNLSFSRLDVFEIGFGLVLVVIL